MGIYNLDWRTDFYSNILDQTIIYHEEIKDIIGVRAYKNLHDFLVNLIDYQKEEGF